MDIIENYFRGKNLYGDDFNAEEIKQWFEDEKEAYADLGENTEKSGKYLYHQINKTYGFKSLKKTTKIETALGIGSAFGDEFLPIISKIENLYILESSEQLRSDKISGKKPTYKTPNISGKIDFDDCSFDLVICLGVLHHIPNVSYVISEIQRVLKPGGIFILREPIVSMGDWRIKRPGLTKHERGIPVDYLKGILKKLDFNIEKLHYCFTMSAFLQRKLRKLFKRSLITYKSYVLFDKLLSNLFSWNIHYHPRNAFQRIGPQSVYMVLRK